VEFAPNVEITSGACGKFIDLNIKITTWFIYCRCIIALVLATFTRASILLKY